MSGATSTDDPLMLRVGVIGHVEWMELAVVDRAPAVGEIAHADDTWSVAAGGGAIAAVVVRELVGESVFWTVVGTDGPGGHAVAELGRRGVEVRAARAVGHATRRGFSQLSPDGERTITVIGERLSPGGALPLGVLDGVYVTAADAALLAEARGAARVVVATPRVGPALVGAEIDVLVGSDSDPGEDLDLAVRAGAVVRTRGGEGGVWAAADGTSGSWPAAPLPGPVADAFGCGDAFAAALTVELARGATMGDACAHAAAVGAHRLTLRGPYGT